MQNPFRALVAVLLGTTTPKSLTVDAGGNLQIGGAGVGPAPDYQLVAASQTAKVLGATGAIGDLITSLTIMPATAAGGVVTLIDGSGGGAITIPIYAGGGTTAANNLLPVTVPLNLKSTVGGWHITTGANIAVVAAGNFT